MALLHIGDAARGRLWAEMLPALVPGLEVRQWPDIGDPADIRYVAAWTLPPGLARSLPKLALVISIGAGVDQLDPADLPDDVPLLRMSEPALVEGMVEFAVMCVLMLHRDMPFYLQDQREARWSPRPRRPAARRNVGILGAGAMGRAVLERLTPFGFALSAWSRTAKRIPDVECFAGDAQLGDFLKTLDILLCLLPLTAQTRGILSTSLFACLPMGCALANLGRGGHLVADDLLAALDAGMISAAMLDVTDPEPLPPAHALWRHPHVLLTPHIASNTDPAAGATRIARIIHDAEARQPLPGLVDRSLGY